MTDQHDDAEIPNDEQDGPGAEPLSDIPAEEAPAEAAEDQPAEETPAEEAAASEEEPAAEAEQPASEEASAEEASAAAEEASAEAEEPAAEEAPATEEPAADETSQEAPAAPAAAEKPKGDAIPGAELEPIRIEDDRPLSTEERARAEAEAEERARLEAEAADEPTDEAPRTPTVEIPSESRIQATGKRKTAIARVILTPGSGVISINKRTLDEYFPRDFHRTTARQALVASGYDGQVDVKVRVHGGGISGQADAVRHGIARALTEIDPELRGELKRRGLLTRDARAKERRKAGLKKARKRPQFSKR
jgi:small subunit ribosomal protein S9